MIDFTDLYPPSAKGTSYAQTGPRVAASGMTSGSATGSASGSIVADGFPALWVVGFIIGALVIIHFSE